MYETNTIMGVAYKRYKSERIIKAWLRNEPTKLLKAFNGLLIRIDRHWAKSVRGEASCDE